MFVKNIFEANPVLNRVAIKGEISNFKRHSSGHLYMSIKDETGVIRAVMFRFAASKLSFLPENGTKVVAEGRVSVYERDGQYQLYIDSMQPDGVGELHIKFEKLKQMLGAEGLFDPRHKKPLPKYPKKIGVVTAPTGAAVRDIINVLSRRFKYSDVVLYPVLVQGENAAPDIVGAIEFFNKNKYADVLIVGRGGGSIEDLWAFNEEIVARAIFKSEIPIISAVGHEIDFTISDFVADLRAPTPSAAAELVVPDERELAEKFGNVEKRLRVSAARIMESKKLMLKYFADKNVLKNPVYSINERRMYLDSVCKDFEASVAALVAAKKRELSSLAAKLEGLSPLGAVARGFSVVFGENGEVVNKTSDVKSGEKIEIRVSDGNVRATVD